MIFLNRQIYDNYIVQVIRHGNLTNAAKALQISQPALSQGLNTLEKQLGFKIFNRRANPITLTPEGELYYRYIQRVDVLHASFEKELSEYRKDMETSVTIGAPAVYVSSVIVPAIKRLGDPGVRISIRTAPVEQLIALAESGSIDCFISTMDELPEHFSCEKICREEIVLCVPEDSLITSAEQAVEEKERFIFLEETMPLQQAVNRFLEERQLCPASMISIDQVSGAISMVEEGLGVCFASKEAARGHHVRTIATNIIGRTIYLACDRELYHPGACEKLMTAILNM